MQFEDPHEVIAHIFRVWLPKFGMSIREQQIALADQLLDAMLDREIALCDAGTGIGKTDAYLSAGVVFQYFRDSCGLPFQPIIISTSSIALQEAVQEEYLPRLSRALLAAGMIQQPLQTVIRKGRNHYVCDERLRWRLEEIRCSGKTNAKKALSGLWDHLDIRDSDHLKSYDRKRICVPQVCRCQREHCRYRDFIESCRRAKFPFQICNHNLLLADAIHRSSGVRPVLPDYSAIIMDEAHRLPEISRQMLGDTLTAEDIAEAAALMRDAHFPAEARLFIQFSKPILQKMNRPPGDDSIEAYTTLLEKPERVLKVFLQRFKYHINPPLRGRLEKLLATVDIFCAKNPGKVLYAEQNEQGNTVLCATVPDISEPLQRILWDIPRPITLVSGTLAIGHDFRSFREKTGLLNMSRVQEAVFPSPFDYKKNCLLYFPRHAPGLRGHSIQSYYNALAEECVRLITAASGHTLLLFTSYEDMSWIVRILRERKPDWCFFTMRRNSAEEVKKFRAHPGSILLATGAAWEGFDFPGDCVSLLIIPRLPFPRPNAVLEYMKKRFPSLREFIRTIVVPEMQIRLRQGFGRAIRTETDTCVVAILDERSPLNRGYFFDVTKALPEIRCTSDIGEVRHFIHSVKSSAYFREFRKPEGL